MSTIDQETALRRGAVLGPTIVAALAASGAKPPDPIDHVRRVLTNRFPGVAWQFDRAIEEELTGDRQNDLAVPGRRGSDSGFAVGVVVGPVAPTSPMLSMVWPGLDQASEDCARCGAPILVAEPPRLPDDLWGCSKPDEPGEFCAGVRRLDAWLQEAAVNGMHGLTVTGAGDCTEVHLYWDPRSKQFDQWQAK